MPFYSFIPFKELLYLNIVLLHIRNFVLIFKCPFDPVAFF